MNAEQVRQLKTLVEDAGDLPESAKAKLLELLTQTQTDAEEAPVDEPEAPLGQWQSALTEFEAAHPEATGFMNRLATTLANMGI